jgi:quinol monooxygenase YgiN
MFGTIYQMKPRAGQEQAVAEHMRRWERERRPNAAGAVGGYLFRSRTDPDTLVGVTVFDSEASYMKNAGDPAQDLWYRQLRELLEADPKWNDGDVLVAI